jgi:hypothetical protein
VSKIVKQIIDAESRSSLQQTKQLHPLIAKRIEQEIKNHPDIEYFYIDGIRQFEIVENLTNSLDDKLYRFYYIWVDSSTLNRMRRFNQRKAAKDKGLTFEQAEKGDEELGISELEKQFKKQPTFTLFLNN